MRALTTRPARPVPAPRAAPRAAAVRRVVAAPAPRPLRRAAPVAARASADLTVKEPSTGVAVPEVATLWAGGPARCLGGGARVKKIAIVKVKVYAVFLYVDAAPAAKELGVRSRGGFFDGDDDADYAAALTDGAFAKAIRIDMVRDVDGATFVAALDEALAPRLRLAGDTASLDKLRAFFEAKKLAKGSSMLLLWRPDGVLDVATAASPDRAAATYASPDAAELSIASPGLCRALFEVYLGSTPVSPDARAAWARGARALLATEEVKRDTRKGGS